MRRRKPLSVVPTDAPLGLGLETIMDPGLAAQLGVRYVHLAVFAIDVDRIHVEHGEDEGFPLGFEVLLTERYMTDRLDPSDPEQRELITEVCESAMEGGQRLGAQIPFAIYAAIDRGAWPDDLRPLFRGWKKRPSELLEALAELRAEPGAVRRLAAACLAAPLDPPVAAPTREALDALSRG